MARILVIDDDENVRSMLRRLLSANGHEVLCAVNGQRAAEIMEEQAPELVITDIIMPEKDGIETIRMLRAQFPQAHIIAISGGGTRVEMDPLPIARMLGAELTLSKPIDNSVLLDAVARVTGTSRGD